MPVILRRLLGLAAFVGLVVALAMAVAGIAGVDIPERSLAWLPALAMAEFLAALVASMAALRTHAHFVVPREASAGLLAIVLVAVLAVAAPGRLTDGRPAQVGARHVVADEHGAVRRELSVDEYQAARRAEHRVECAAMAIFLYVAVLAFLVPTRTWSATRVRRRGDLAGSAFNIRGADASP